MHVYGVFLICNNSVHHLDLVSDLECNEFDVFEVTSK